jgi:hypothetical protein
MQYQAVFYAHDAPAKEAPAAKKKNSVKYIAPGHPNKMEWAPSRRVDAASKGQLGN